MFGHILLMIFGRDILNQAIYYESEYGTL